MIRQLSIVAIAAACVAVIIAVFTWPGEAQPRAARAPNDGQTTTSSPIHVISNNARYDAGMRIIHVPQPGEDADYSVTTDSVTDDEVEMALPPKPARRRVVMPAPPQPKRILPPQPSGLKRSVLSAPAPLADGPSPIRPLPKWRSSEKFTVPAAPIVADPVPTDAVTAVIPPENTPTAAPGDMPAIDDDAPPPTD